MNKDLIKIIKEEFPYIWKDMKDISISKDRKNLLSKYELKALIELKRHGELNATNLTRFKEIV